MRTISPALFGITVICFFLPFVTVSCQNQSLASFSGIQLAFGTTMEQPSLFGQAQSRKIDGIPAALLALIACGVGLFVGIVGAQGDSKPIPSLLAAVSGLVLLLFLKSGLDDEILKQGNGLLHADFSPGFWLACLLQLSAVGLNGYILMNGSTTVTVRFCPQCGGKNPEGNDFCSDCGKTFELRS